MSENLYWVRSGIGYVHDPDDLEMTSSIHEAAVMREDQARQVAKALADGGFGVKVELLLSAPPTFKAIERVLDEFDFAKVHRAMVALGWKWRDDEDGELRVPSREWLLERAKYLLYRAASRPGRVTQHGSGGFEATIERTDGSTRHSALVHLAFIVEEVAVDPATGERV